MTRFWRICCLKEGPQQIPASRDIFWLTLVLNLLTGTIYLAIAESFFLAFLVKLISLSVVTVVVAALLYMRGRPSRFVQTMSAIFGSGIIVNLLIWIVLYLEMLLPNIPFLLLGIWVFYLAWSLLIVGHILRHALDIALFYSCLIVLGITLFNELVFRLLF